MIQIRRFEPHHLDMLGAPSPRGEAGGVSRWTPLLADGGPSFTVMNDAGDVVACCGTVESHANHTTMWASFAVEAGPLMLGITRRTRWFLRKLEHRRIDAIVRAEHRAGHRWVNQLGFAPEARLNDYFADGGDAVIYRWRAAWR